MIDDLPEPSPLEASLVDLIEADDRAAFAREHGIGYENGAVDVRIELVGNGDLPEAYVQEVTARQGEMIFAWVRVEDLVDLALSEDVRIVRPRSEPMAH